MYLCVQIADSRMDDSLLNYYKKEWDRITTSMSYISRIFRYLVRRPMGGSEKGVFYCIWTV